MTYPYEFEKHIYFFPYKKPLGYERATVSDPGDLRFIPEEYRGWIQPELYTNAYIYIYIYINTYKSMNYVQGEPTKALNLLSR